jgi:hypothetical protein
MRRRPPLLLSPCALPLPNISQRYGRFSVGCCVPQLNRSHRNRRPHRPLFFNFFRRSIRHLIRWTNVLPHAFRPFESPLQSPPPPPTPSFGWLSRLFFKWRPPKTGAPPITQFVDGRHFGAPNKGTKRRAREPGRRAPLLGSWGGAAPRFGSMADVAMETREGKAAGGRVAEWQRLVVLCVLCLCACFFFSLLPVFR